MQRSVCRATNTDADTDAAAALDKGRRTLVFGGHFNEETKFTNCLVDRCHIHLSVVRGGDIRLLGIGLREDTKGVPGSDRATSEEEVQHF